MSAIRLGLIGGNIAASQSPALHRIAGRLSGLDVSYELLTPSVLNKSFDDVFEHCVRDGFRGLNITYPFKEEVMGRVVLGDPVQAAIGSCNTVVFDTPRHRGANTDFSGFMKAFRQTFGAASPGHVTIAGSGGVGKAIAFALATLGADGLAIFDVDRAKAEALKATLKHNFAALPVSVESTIADAAKDADGLVNCTPLGMDGKGTAFPAELLRSQLWAFDAVYTPVNTPFLQAARKAGIAVMSGYELFLYQGIDAFRIFTGHDVDPAALRQALGTYPEQVRSA
jgi:shikimate dehydrogenase